MILALGLAEFGEHFLDRDECHLASALGMRSEPFVKRTAFSAAGAMTVLRLLGEVNGRKHSSANGWKKIGLVEDFFQLRRYHVPNLHRLKVHWVEPEPIGPVLPDVAQERLEGASELHCPLNSFDSLPFESVAISEVSLPDRYANCSKNARDTADRLDPGRPINFFVRRRRRPIADDQACHDNACGEREHGNNCPITVSASLLHCFDPVGGNQILLSGESR